MTKYSRFFVALAVILTAAISTVACGKVGLSGSYGDQPAATKTRVYVGCQGGELLKSQPKGEPNVDVAMEIPCPKVRNKGDHPKPAPVPTPAPTPAPVKPPAPKPQVSNLPSNSLEIRASGRTAEKIIDALRGSDDPVFSPDNAAPPVPPMPPATGTPPVNLFPPKPRVGPGGISNPEPPRRLLTPAERDARNRTDYDKAMVAARERLAIMGRYQGS